MRSCGSSAWIKVPPQAACADFCLQGIGAFRCVVLVGVADDGVVDPCGATLTSESKQGASNRQGFLKSFPCRLGAAENVGANAQRTRSQTADSTRFKAII